MAPKLKEWEAVKNKTLNSKQNGDMTIEQELVLKQAHELMKKQVADYMQATMQITNMKYMLD